MAPRTRPALRTLVAALIGLVLPLALLGSPASAVNADHGDRVVSDRPAAFTPHVMDGAVIAVTQVGNKMIAAGNFTTVRQTPTGADIPRNRIFAFDATTGAIDMSFNPNLGGSVNSLDTDGTHVYVGGSFGSVGGNTAIRRLVKLTAAGTVVTAFNAVPNSFVNEVVVKGSRLYVGGGFGSIRSGNVSTSRGAFAALDSTTGAVLGAVDIPFTGTYNGGGTNVKRFDVTPDGTRLVAVGNFITVAGQPREQIAVVDLPATGQASLSSWSTDRFSRARNTGCARVFDTWMRDIDFAPDGTWFVVTTTGAFGGGANSGTLCDTASRWETSSTGNEPTWVDYVGGDTLYGVAVTGSAVYIGGHQRWTNNPFQGDQAGPGAVPGDGISALDPVNGLPLAWNPGRTRGVGAQAMFATPQGLWVGSDTIRIAGQLRHRIALMPLAGGTTLPAVIQPRLPNDVFVAPRTAGTTSDVLYRVNAGGGPLQSGDSGPDWTGDSGLVTGGNTAGWASTVPLDATVPTGTPPGLFTSERWSQQDWNFPVAAGRDITVRLYFANQCTCTAAVGQRRFNVLIDGQTVLADFDVVAAVGDRRATMRSFDLTSDGNVDIDLRAIVENPLVNAIEILDRSADVPPPTAPGALTRLGLGADGTPTGTAAQASTAMDFSQVRGAALVGSTLYYGRADGSLYKRAFDPATAATGAEQVVDLYDDPDDGARIPFAISNLTGMTFDASSHRLYYTVFGDSRLFYRYFTPSSEVVGAQTFTAPTNGVNLAGVAGLVLADGRLLFGSRADGALRSVPFTGDAITGTPTVLSADGTWRHRDMFLSTTSSQPPVEPPANEVPTASFTAGCEALVCTFDASASTDPDGSITDYDWTFGDDSTGTGPQPSHTYAAAGTYTATLTVTDDSGATASTTRQVTATQDPPPNQPPTASFTVGCEALVCTFDASASTDPDGSITDYDWTFGDGSTDAGPQPSHTYAAAGTYTATLTVTDSSGATASTTRQVTATQDPPPASPVAFRAAASTNGNVVSARVTVPADVQPGDALVLSMTQNADRALTEPAGLGTWTTLGTQVGDLNQIRTTTWAKVAAAGDAGGTVTVTLSARAKVTLSLLAYSGTSTTDPVHSYAATSETALTASHTTPGATGAPAGSWVVSGWSDKTSATESWTDPAGTTQRVEEVAAGAGRVATQISDAGPVAAGDQPGVTATAEPNSASRKAVMWTLVLRPGGAG